MLRSPSFWPAAIVIRFDLGPDRGRVEIVGLEVHRVRLQQLLILNEIQFQASPRQVQHQRRAAVDRLANMEREFGDANRAQSDPGDFEPGGFERFDEAVGEPTRHRGE